MHKEDIEIVNDVTEESLARKVRWETGKIKNFNPDGIDILYDIYWGQKNDGDVICLACEHDSTQTELFRTDNFLVIGESKEHIASIIRAGTLKSPSHVSSRHAIEIAENKAVFLFNCNDRKLIMQRNKALQEQINKLRKSILLLLET